jgi:dinuclear metal center YbgI/SA1388 family protein
MRRQKLLDYLDEFLNAKSFTDYGPNGLQVEGRDNIRQVVTAVSASVELFRQAIALEADAVIVHHGIIWDFERPLYKGGYKQRVKMLLENDINLFAYHLPLDAHPEVGNAAQMAKLLGMSDCEAFGAYHGSWLGIKGQIAPRPAEELFALIREQINPAAIVFPFGSLMIENIGIISGGAPKEIRQAVAGKLDLFLTGEAAEFVMHYAQEEKIHFVAAGHYATERFGIRVLGEHIRQKFSIKVDFLDIPNPV